MNEYKSGFVSIIGLPNAGKSTLLNRLIGQKVSIVSSKPQTTRNRITGVLSGEGYQIVFLDTPGVASPKNRLGEYMRTTALGALNEIDIILYVLDPIRGMRERDDALLLRVEKSKAPCIGVINKSDIADEDRLNSAKAFLEGRCEHSLILSAQTGEGADALKELLIRYLSPGPQYFPGDMYTDQPERMIIAEFIREKALELLRDEVPHGIGVEVDRMGERGDITDVYATIYCERETHKGIIIGKKGTMLRRIGEQSRMDIEVMLDAHVNLQLYVKVREGWRDKPLALKELGYE